MNILPLVAAFTILFSAGIYTFFHESVNLFQERYHIFGALDIDRQIGNKNQKEKYLKSEGESQNAQENNGSSLPKEKLPPRSPNQVIPAQKLNLRKLGQNNPSAKLYKVATKLVKHVYGSTSLYKEGLEKEVVDTLINLIKEHPDVPHLEALLPFIPQERSVLFYKLFKGTQNEGGYPALTDFVQLGGKNEKPIHLRRASRPLILSLLGPIIGQDLLNEEMNKWATLTKAEWDTFFIKHQLNGADFADLVDYSNRKGGVVEKKLHAKDQKVQVKHSFKDVHDDAKEGSK